MRLKLSVIFLILGACFAWQQAAFADQYFDYGVRLLKKGHYAAARRYFEQRLKYAPQDEKAHYYKALTHHYAGDRPTAKDLYQYIIDNFPDSEMAGLAAKNLEKIKAAEDAGKTEEQKEADKKIETDAKDAQKSKLETAIETAKREYQEKIAPLVKRKEEILGEASSQAQKIIADAHKRIEEENRTTNQLIQYRSTGVITTGLTDEEEREIRWEAQKQSDAIMRVAKLRADGIKIPPEPDWASFTLPSKNNKMARRSPPAKQLTKIADPAAAKAPTDPKNGTDPKVSGEPKSATEPKSPGETTGR